MLPAHLAAVSPISVAELRVWTLLVAGLAYWGNVVRTARQAGPIGLDSVAEAVIRNGAFCAAAWVLIAAQAGGAGAAEPAGGRRIAAAVAVCLLGVAPSRQTAILLLFLLGVQLAWPAGTRPARKIAALLFAVGFDMAWTSPYALPLHAAVANLDAQVVPALLRGVGLAAGARGNLVDNASSGFGIEVLARCASSYPLGGICLAFVVTSVHLRRFPRWRDAPWLAASLIASAVLTEIRLAWMTMGKADYLWLHEGGGVTLYTFAAVGFAVLFPLLAVRSAPGARPVP